MTKPTLRAVVLLLTLPASIAFAHPVAQTAEAVLHANQEAMGDFPKTGTLRVQYSTEVSGLKGTAIYTADLATGTFVDDLTADPLSGANGWPVASRRVVTARIWTTGAPAETSTRSV